MFKVVTFLARVVRVIRNAFLFAGCVCVVLFIVLSVAEIPLPARVIDAVTARLSTDTTSLHVERAAVSVSKGLALSVVQCRINLATNDLFIQAREMRLDLSIRPRQSCIKWVDGIRLVRPEAVFLPSASPRGTGHEGLERDLTQIQLSRVRVELEDPVFCGIAPARATADLTLDDGMLVLDNIRAAWPASADTETLSGTVRMDLQSGEVEGHATGNLSANSIRPMLVLAGSRSGIHYCNRITRPEVPLTVSCDLRLTPDLQTLRFELNARDITWNDRPISHIACTIEAVNPVGQQAWRVTLSPLQADTADGSVRGSLVYEEATGLLTVEAQSEMPAQDLFDILELFRNGILDRLLIGGVPRITVSGTLDADSTRTLPYDLTGTIEAPAITIYGLPLARTTCDFTVSNQFAVSFDNIHAQMMRGGGLDGRFSFELTDDKPEMPWRAEVAIADATLHDLFLPLNKTNLWEGGVSGSLALAGTFGTDPLAALSGGGCFALTGAVLSRVPLFAGFTTYLARTIPGVELLVSQSDASFSFLAEAGVITSRDLLVEGDFFSMSGQGTYSLIPQELNVAVRANIFRKNTIAGHVARIIALPFERLLLEFLVTGSPACPQWHYRGIIQRIVSSVSGSDAEPPPDDSPQKPDSP